MTCSGHVRFRPGRRAPKDPRRGTRLRQVRAARARARHGSRQGRLPAGVSARGRPAKPPRLPVRARARRSRARLGRDRRGDRGDRRARLHLRVRLRRRRGARVRRDRAPRHRRSEGALPPAAPPRRDLRRGVPHRAARRFGLLRHDDDRRGPRRPFPPPRTEALHRRRHRGRLFPRLRPDRSERRAAARHLLHARRSRAGRGDELHLRPHGLPRRRREPRVVQGRARAESEPRRRARRRRRGLRHDDDPRAPRHRGDDHRRRAARARDRYALHEQAQGLRAAHQPLPGRELPSRGRRDAPRRLARDGPLDLPRGRKRRSARTACGGSSRRRRSS